MSEFYYNFRNKYDRHVGMPGTVYITVIRPILEYACQVWHYNIQNVLSEDIERIQKRALKIIVPISSYGESLKITGIATLYERRARLCHQFFQQNKNNASITELFPDPYTSNYDLRLRRKYNNYVCKTDRFKHSLPQMIFKVNNKIV